VRTGHPPLVITAGTHADRRIPMSPRGERRPAALLEAYGKQVS
jgi:hypothetical protein